MTRIAPTQDTRQRRPRARDKDYKGWIAQLSCAICGRKPVEVAHVRYSDARYLKENPGMQQKPDDFWTLPLCPEHHRLGTNAQHNRVEQHWWRMWKIEPLTLCLILRHRCYPDTLLAKRVLEEWRGV